MSRLLSDTGITDTTAASLHKYIIAVIAQGRVVCNVGPVGAADAVLHVDVLPVIQLCRWSSGGRLVLYCSR